MVIKTNTCVFSDAKIYPGHGMRFCEVNGRSHYFLNKKVHKFFKAGRKSLSFRWSNKWRIAHKKLRNLESKTVVKKQRKERVVKALVGRSLEDLNKLKASFDEKTLDAQRYKYAQEIKDKRKKYLEKTRKNKPVTSSAKVDTKGAKNVKNTQQGGRKK